MTFRLATAGDLSSRPLSLLERKSSHSNLALSSSQRLVDGAVGSFVDQATDWKSMAAILAGTGAYRLGRMGVMRFEDGNILRAVSVGAGLAAEVSAFEFTNRGLVTMAHRGGPVWPPAIGSNVDGHPHGGAPTNHFESNLWKWSGPNGLKHGLFSSLITFGTLKGIGGLTQGENLILRHAAQDVGMVFGHQLAYQGGAGPKPEGTWAEQLLEAEATNLKLSAAMALVGKGTGRKDGPFEKLNPSRKLFFPPVLAVKPAPSREAALGPRWMMMAAEVEGKAEGFGKKLEGISKEAKEEELIRFAYESLEQWRKNPETPFDYGKFFLEVETELGQQTLSEAQKQKAFDWYDRKLTSHKAALFAPRNYGRNDVERAIRMYMGLPPDMQKQAMSLAHQYPKTFLIHSDNKANMSDFALCGRGNCSARAKFVLATGSGARLPLPENLKWGVQNYDNHLETVLYDETAGQIWVLSSGRVRVVDKIEATVYDPALFFHAFLKNKGVISPVKTKDLILLKVPENPNSKTEPSFGGEEPFEFPSTSSHFRPGETFWGHAIQLPGPEFSWAPRRGILLLLAGAAAASLLLQNRKKEIPIPQKKDDTLPKPVERQEVERNKAVLWKDAQWTRPVTQQQFFGKDPTTQIQYTGFYIMPEGHLILEKAEDIAAFDQLSTPEERYHFLVKVAERKETEEDFQAAFAFLLGPAQAIRNISPEELKKTARFLSSIEIVQENAQSQLERGLFPKNVVPTHAHPGLTERLKSSSLRWTTFYQNLKIWREWSHDRPVEFTALLNETPLEKKMTVLEISSVKSLLYEKGGLTLSKSKKEETPFDPAQGPKTVDVLIEMDLLTDEFEGPPPEKIYDPPPEKAAPPQEEAPPETTITISPETALMYALYWRSFKARTPLLQNWSPEITRTFMELNRNGEYDEPFLAAVKNTLSNKTGVISYPLAKAQLPPSMGPILDDIARRHPKGFEAVPAHSAE